MLSRRMEPRAPSPARRLKTIERLVSAGCPVRIMASPMIPALTDQELEGILQAGKDAGASAASYILLRLPREVSGLFYDWLSEHYPDRAARVKARVRETHGGKDYDPEWGKRMRGEGVHASLIARRFELARQKHGLDVERKRLRCDLFRVPPRSGGQLTLGI